jgi:hypothetical protein
MKNHLTKMLILSKKKVIIGKATIKKDKGRESRKIIYKVTILKIKSCHFEKELKKN